ncbi:unnamed protein product, partial [Symbiodinium sp. CCMP2456]
MSATSFVSDAPAFHAMRGNGSEGWDLAGRKTFSYMSFDEDVEDVDCVNCDLDDAEVNAPFRRYKTWPLIEEKPMLRKRTAGLG